MGLDNYKVLGIAYAIYLAIAIAGWWLSLPSSFPIWIAGILVAGGWYTADREYGEKIDRLNYFMYGISGLLPVAVGVVISPLGGV